MFLSLQDRSYNGLHCTKHVAVKPPLLHVEGPSFIGSLSLKPEPCSTLPSLITQENEGGQSRDLVDSWLGVKLLLVQQD